MRMYVFLIALSITIFPFNIQETTGQQSEESEEIATKFVSMLAKENFVSAVKAFDENMSKILPPEKLQQSWTAFIEKAGPFQKHIATRKQKIDQYEVVFVTCEFARSSHDVKVVLNSSEKIAGLFFVPVEHVLS